ncbi:MAG: hypothetical protein CGU29_12480 [Candidatus Dactylopiibacterium carminicum]|uniref:Chorismatase FkbO/Hyg5-like N-terminal domain-containing protein n=1 Tax=Candidatus Dactylopiibacterium carminicum TaxID=857335 RepID=A0A272EQ80_9RHOO|nr:hypothetical protein [Candidatus Dactylopiibacterium carminicum]KAF7598464.1 hypothetical protein BGI27_13215 [Candidatus Dactylopiibacterium carminicum]PAS92206.1 MAG: hypothetical protein CGU29_12480 [Candidatus Dactylopiibacterium carminicum]
MGSGLLSLRIGQDALTATGRLGLALYGADVAAADGQTAAVRMPLLPDGGGIATAWLGEGPVVSGRHGQLHYCHNADYLFGCVSLREQDFTPSADTSALQQASELIYILLFEVLTKTGFPCLLRCWNYLPSINHDDGGLERYRQFNIGRQDAFIAAGQAWLDGAPSACALGTAEGELLLYFLAGHVAPVPIENPRQTSAYRYPQQYGPRSPTFSRASVLRAPAQTVLFISGTAAIVGHASMHPGDVLAQTRETLANIEALLESSAEALGKRLRLPDLCLKVFMRHPGDLPVVMDVLAAHGADPARSFYLQADVCRAELLVEIEAFGFGPGAGND